MKRASKAIVNGADLVQFLSLTPLLETRRRDLVSSVHRVSDLTGCTLATLSLDPNWLRAALAKVRPAKHRLTRASWSTLRSAFASALALAEIADRIPRGVALHDPTWKPLVSAIAKDRRLGNGLALFVNWCATNAIAPAAVGDGTVQLFVDWLIHATIYPRPTDVACRVPKLWNEAAKAVAGWPSKMLVPLSFRKQSDKLRWDELDGGLRNDAEAYLQSRSTPDPFGDGPARPLAGTTLRQQREHIRLAASVLVAGGQSAESLRSLADLVEPDAVKAVLRHYFDRAGRKPSAFAEAVAKTLLSIARSHVRVTGSEMNQLKAILRKLPSIPFDLTEKNKSLLRQFDSEQLVKALLDLPAQLIEEAKGEYAGGEIPLVKAECAIAIDILLVAPLRPQNLSRINLHRHIREPDGPRGRMQLFIPAGETKTRRRDLTFEIPPEVAQRLRWYRRTLLPAVGADPNGDIFVTFQGRPKGQETLSEQLTETLNARLGVHMTPHQFRHLAAKLYLDAHPEDFETVRALLGHAFAKTTQIYAGNGTERASRAYGSFVLDKRQSLGQPGRRDNRARNTAAQHWTTRSSS